jgi:fatty-acyl-CoA synthase
MPLAAHAADAITHSFGGDDMFKAILEHCAEPAPFPAARVFGYGIFQPGGHAFAVSASQRGLPLFGLYGSSELQARAIPTSTGAEKHFGDLGVAVINPWS